MALGDLIKIVQKKTWYQHVGYNIFYVYEGPGWRPLATVPRGWFTANNATLFYSNNYTPATPTTQWTAEYITGPNAGDIDEGPVWAPTAFDPIAGLVYPPQCTPCIRWRAFVGSQMLQRYFFPSFDTTTNQAAFDVPKTNLFWTNLVSQTNGATVQRPWIWGGVPGGWFHFAIYSPKLGLHAPVSQADPMRWSFQRRRAVLRG